MPKADGVAKFAEGTRPEYLFFEIPLLDSVIWVVVMGDFNAGATVHIAVMAFLAPVQGLRALQGVTIGAARTFTYRIRCTRCLPSIKKPYVCWVEGVVVDLWGGLLVFIF